MSTKLKPIGHATSVFIDMSGPIEMPRFELELKNINLFIGTNGIGKSLILKLTWVMNMIACAVTGDVKGTELIDTAQFILDNSIPETNTCSAFGIKYQSGGMISIIIQGGKVSNVDYTGFEDISQAPTPVFMSTTMRLFSGMKYYFAMRALLPNDPQQRIAGLVKDFKLYDIMYIEGLLIRMPYVVDQKLLSMLNKFDMKLDLVSIEFENNDLIGTYGNSDRKSLSLLGNGHQSILNMSLGNILNS